VSPRPPPSAYYRGLDNPTSLAEPDTLAGLSGEPAGNGYARETVSSDAPDFAVGRESSDCQTKARR
jgi:hypothetical protein